MKHRFIKDFKALISTLFTAAILLEPDQIFIIEKYIFAFNINNVLIYNKKVLSEVIKTIKVLNK